MPQRSNHAFPDDGAAATSKARETMQMHPNIIRVSEILRLTLLLMLFDLSEL